MATKLSSNGLEFIASWSLFSSTTFKIKQQLTEPLQIGYCYYGGQLPGRLPAPITAESTVTSEEAKTILEQELISPSCFVLNSVEFNSLSQNEFDALVSILTTFRTSDYINEFKQTKLYEAIQNKENPQVVSEIIRTDTPPPLYVSNNFKQFGVFYDFDTRRNYEANLYLNNVYSLCPGLTFNEEIIDGITVFS